MLVGCYYRCPIVVEEGDRDHPRFYVLAQLIEYNEIADAVKVEMHDLLGSRQYYGDLFLPLSDHDRAERTASSEYSTDDECMGFIWSIMDFGSDSGK